LKTIILSFALLFVFLPSVANAAPDCKKPAGYDEKPLHFGMLKCEPVEEEHSFSNYIYIPMIFLFIGSLISGIYFSFKRNTLKKMKIIGILLILISYVLFYFTLDNLLP